MLICWSRNCFSIAVVRGCQRVYAWRVIRAKICMWRVIVNSKETWFTSTWMQVTRDSWIICFWSWKCRFTEVFPTITDSKRSHGLLSVNVISVTVSHQNLTSSLTSCAASLVTVSDLWDVSAYIQSTVLSEQEIRNSKFKQSNWWTKGHGSIKNSKVCGSWGEGAQQTEVKFSTSQSYLQNWARSLLNFQVPTCCKSFQTSVLYSSWVSMASW